MKAKLKLVNIGQRVGEENWEFNSGKVSVIRGRTAAGKSRILKSCTLALSLPITSEDIKKDAIGFGIAKAENKKFSPLLNTNKDSALIELEYNNIFKKVELLQDGTENINSPGNQKFIYCSMLTENSKIHKNIDQGISDFSWIVSEMSFAKNYQTVEGVVESYIDLLGDKSEEIEKLKESKIENQSTLKQKQKDRDKINNEIDILEKEINSIQLNPQLKERRKLLVSTLKQKRDELKEHQKTFNQLEGENKDIQKNLTNKSDSIEKNNESMGKLMEDKKTISQIDEKDLNNQIDQLRVDNENLYKSQKDELQKLGGLSNDKKRLMGVIKELQKSEEDKTLCWTCGKSYISKDEVEKDLSSINKDIEPIQAKLNSIDKTIQENNDKIISIQNKKKKLNDLPNIEEKYNTFRKKNAELIAQKNKLEENFKKKKASLLQYSGKNNILDSLSKSIDKDDSELKEIDKKISKNEEAKSKINKKDTLVKKLGNVEKEISDLEILISKGDFIELLDNKIEIEKADKIINGLQEILNKIKTYLVSSIKEQREGAAIKFNKNIKKIIEELNFTEFKEILLDLVDYNLNIIRKDGTNQPINSLSGGEKVVISSLLQISAKETYNPEIPFIVGDDIILKMDDVRRESFENYLKTIANEKDWFIILTRITDEDLIKEEL